jgi:drug/metabolite transporter (DMT)-like permease
MSTGPGAAQSAAPGPSLAPSRVVGPALWGPLLTLWIVWGTTYVGTAAMVQSIPPLLGAGSRYFVGAIPLAIIVVLARGPRAFRLTRPQLVSSMAMGLGIIGIWGAIVPLSLQHIPGGIAALIAASVPVWVVLLRALAREPVTGRTVAGILLGIGGVAAMMLPGGIAPLAGTDAGGVLLWSLAMVMASISWAFFSWRSRSLDLPSDTGVLTVYQLLWCGLGITVVGLIVGERADVSAYTASSMSGWVWLVVASAIGYASYTWLITRAPLPLVSTFAFVNPAVAVFVGWYLLGEPLSRSVVIGLVVVLGGTTLVVLGDAPHTSKGPTRIAGGAS